MFKTYHFGRWDERGKKLAEAIGNIKMTRDGKTIFIKASIGLSDNSNAIVKDFNQLFHFTDVALYKEKSNGKNQIYVEN